MNTTTTAPAPSTITCMTCGGVTETDSPWTDTRVTYCTTCVASAAKFERMAHLERIAEQARITAGMGMYQWDRKRGAKLLDKTMTELGALVDSLTPAEGAAYGAYRRARG